MFVRFWIVPAVVVVLWWFSFVTFLRDRPSLSLPLCCFCEWTAPVPAVLQPSCSGQKTVSSSSLSWAFPLALLLFFLFLNVMSCVYPCQHMPVYVIVCSRLPLFDQCASERIYVSVLTLVQVCACLCHHYRRPSSPDVVYSSVQWLFQPR